MNLNSDFIEMTITMSHSTYLVGLLGRLSEIIYVNIFYKNFKVYYKLSHFYSHFNLNSLVLLDI